MKTEIELFHPAIDLEVVDERIEAWKQREAVFRAQMAMEALRLKTEADQRKLALQVQRAALEGRMRWHAEMLKAVSSAPVKPAREWKPEIAALAFGLIVLVMLVVRMMIL